MLPINGLAKESWKKGTKKISRCARNDSVGEWISAVSYKVCAGKMFFLYYHFSLRASYKECVGNAFFPYRHPERSRGIFFVGGKRASVRQREMGNTVSRKGGDGASRKRLSEGGGKKGTKKISRCARNDSVGNGYVFSEMSDAPKL